VRTYKKLLIILFILIFPPVACGVMSYNPATEEEELILIPAVKEKNMGRNIHKQVLEKFDLPVDPLMQERIEKIGKKLAKGTDRRDLVYRFTVLNHEKDEFYNAFAVPGGYIYIFDDMVEMLGTDDKVAAVLAHEMGHIEAKHSVKRLQGSLGVTALMLLGAQMRTDRKTLNTANSAIGHLMSAYSRHDEFQADELSIRYMERAWYDTNGALQALETLKKLRKKGPRMRYVVYRSHPYVSERMANLKKVINGQVDFDSYINITSDKDGF